MISKKQNKNHYNHSNYSNYSNNTVVSKIFDVTK